MQAQSDYQSESALSGADTNAADELFARYYTQLKRYARWQIERVSPGHALHATALVHEVYVRLTNQTVAPCQNRAHFLALATTVMRNVLIDAIRRKCADKRGGDWSRVTFTDASGVRVLKRAQLATLADSLKQLESHYPDAARIVMLRFVAGFTMDQIAIMDGVSKRTIERRWRFARAWLQAELRAV